MASINITTLRVPRTNRNGRQFTGVTSYYASVSSTTSGGTSNSQVSGSIAYTDKSNYFSGSQYISGSVYGITGSYEYLEASGGLKVLDDTYMVGDVTLENDLDMAGHLTIEGQINMEYDIGSQIELSVYSAPELRIHEGASNYLSIYQTGITNWLPTVIDDTLTVTTLSGIGDRLCYVDAGGKFETASFLTIKNESGPIEGNLLELGTGLTRVMLDFEYGGTYAKRLTVEADGILTVREGPTQIFDFDNDLVHSHVSAAFDSWAGYTEVQHAFYTDRSFIDKGFFDARTGSFGVQPWVGNTLTDNYVMVGKGNYDISIPTNLINFANQTAWNIEGITLNTGSLINQVQTIIFDNDSTITNLENLYVTEIEAEFVTASEGLMLNGISNSPTSYVLYYNTTNGCVSYGPATSGSSGTIIDAGTDVSDFHRITGSLHISGGLYIDSDEIIKLGDDTSDPIYITGSLYADIATSVEQNVLFYNTANGKITYGSTGSFGTGGGGVSSETASFMDILKAGTDVSDIHMITGSVYISGSLIVDTDGGLGLGNSTDDIIWITGSVHHNGSYYFNSLSNSPTSYTLYYNTTSGLITYGPATSGSSGTIIDAGTDVTDVHKITGSLFISGGLYIESDEIIKLGNDTSDPIYITGSVHAEIAESTKQYMLYYDTTNGKITYGSTGSLGGGGSSSPYAALTNKTNYFTGSQYISGNLLFDNGYTYPTQIDVDSSGKMTIHNYTTDYLIMDSATTEIFNSIELPDISSATSQYMLYYNPTTNVVTYGTTGSLGGGGGGVSLGTNDQIPVMNSSGTDYNYSSDFIFKSETSDLTIGGSQTVSGLILDYSGATNPYELTANSSYLRLHRYTTDIQTWTTVGTEIFGNLDLDGNFTMKSGTLVDLPVCDSNGGSTSTSETLICSNTSITNAIYEGNLTDRVIRVTVNYSWTQNQVDTPSAVIRVKLGTTTLVATTSSQSQDRVGTVVFYITPMSTTQSHVHYTHMYNTTQEDMSDQSVSLVTHGTGDGIYVYFDGAGSIDWDIKSAIIEVLG